MKHYLYLILTITLIITESAFSMAHPLQLVLPTQYFPEEESYAFQMVVLFILGIGYPMLALVSAKMKLKYSVLMLISGLVDVIFLNGQSLLFILAIVLMANHMIKNQTTKEILGLLFLLVGIILATPLVLMTYYSESYVDIGGMQQRISVYRSNDLLKMIIDHWNQLSGDQIIIGLFILLPLVFISPAIQRKTQSHFNIRLGSGIILLSMGIILKTLALSTTSITAFQLIVLLGGLLTATGIFILISPEAENAFAITIILMIADFIMLFIFTGIGLKQYKTLAVDEIALYSCIIGIALSLVYLLPMFMKSIRSKA